MQRLFATSAVLTGLLGVIWTAAPRFMLGQWGTADPDAMTVYMSRRYGGLFFGYAVLMWLARPAGPSALRRAVLVGGAVVSSVMAAISAVGALSGVVTPVVWGAFALEVGLASWFGYYLAFEDRSDAR